jgi:hypothetical protein
MGNLGHISSDPDGGWSWTTAAVGAVAGGGLGAAYGLATDPDSWGWYAAGGAVGGGLIGGSLFNESNIYSKGGMSVKDISTVNVNLPNIDFNTALGIGNGVGKILTNYRKPEPIRFLGERETWDEVSNKRISELQTGVGARARELINRVEGEVGIKLRVTQGVRTIEEQNNLYAQGRTRPGNIVTNARGGQSYHNYGLAFDVVEISPDGSANWNTTQQNWNRISTIAVEIGLEWGGNWKTILDKPHFQRTYGFSIRQLMKIHGIK